jgi:hypothetical protein
MMVKAHNFYCGYCKRLIRSCKAEAHMDKHFKDLMAEDE